MYTEHFQVDIQLAPEHTIFYKKDAVKSLMDGTFSDNYRIQREMFLAVFEKVMGKLDDVWKYQLATFGISRDGVHDELKLRHRSHVLHELTMTFYSECPKDWNFPIYEVERETQEEYLDNYLRIRGDDHSEAVFELFEEFLDLAQNTVFIHDMKIRMTNNTNFFVVVLSPRNENVDGITVVVMLHPRARLMTGQQNQSTVHTHLQ